MGYKILLVDDDTELVKMLSKYFERKKYRVITAQNGKEAIEKYRQPLTLFCWILICLRWMDWKFAGKFEIKFPVRFYF